MAYVACYLLKYNPKFPFSQKVPFLPCSVNYTLTLTRTLNSSPDDFEINIRDGEDSILVYFQMRQEWSEGRTAFNNYDKGWGWPQYVTFPSLKPGSEFTIKISTVREDPRKSEFHFKVRVNDDPVYTFSRMRPGEVSVAEVELKYQNKDTGISVSMVKLER